MGVYEDLTPPESDFITIADADPDMAAAVYYCLPNTAMPATASVEEVRAQLVVVKVHGNNKEAQHEVSILRHIRSTSENWQNYVGSMWVDDYISTDLLSPSWIQLEPVTSAIDLSQLIHRCIALPAFLVWHMFISIWEGLRFVHGLGVVHNDVFASNIMVQLSASIELPRFLIIDFGAAQIGQGDELNDALGLLRLMWHIVEGDLPEDEEDEEGAGGTDSHPLKGETDEAMGVVNREHGLFLLAKRISAREETESWMTISMESIWEWWGDEAIRVRALGPKELPDWIKEKIPMATVTDAQIQSVLEA